MKDPVAWSHRDGVERIVQNQQEASPAVAKEPQDLPQPAGRNLVVLALDTESTELHAGRGKAHQLQSRHFAAVLILNGQCGTVG